MFGKDADNRRPTDSEKHTVRRGCDAAVAAAGAHRSDGGGAAPCKYPDCSCFGQLEALRGAVAVEPARIVEEV